MNAQRAVFVPVESGTTDASPLSATLRSLPIDLRLPTGFSRVYEVRPSLPASLRGGLTLDYGVGSALVGAPPQTDRAEWFARIDGGLVAMFPRSVYVQTPDGVVPEVPPGTIFSIGAPSSVLGRSSPGNTATDTGSTRSSSNGSFFDQSARRPQPAPLQAPGPRPEVERERTTPPASIMSDETYRTRRVRSLLLGAVAERARQSRRAGDTNDGSKRPAETPRKSSDTPEPPTAQPK